MTSESIYRRGIPVLLGLFVFSLVIDQGFKFITDPMSVSLEIDLTTASLQVSLTGIVLAIGIVIYSVLADVVSMRKLIVIAVSLIVAGSIIGFIGQNVWPVVLSGRLIQTAGIASAETLYVIYVTKYFSGNQQRKFLGFSTAAFQLSGMIGILASGIFATYLHWTAMFALPLLALLTLPFLKSLPRGTEQRTVESRIDLQGLPWIAVMAASLVMFVQAFNAIWLVPLAAATGLFVWHIFRDPHAIVDPAFFTNGRYILSISVVVLMYSVYMGFAFFVFPSALPELYGIDAAHVALYMVPGYVCGTLVGVFSGTISSYLTSRTAIIIAIALSVFALIASALFVESAAWVVIASLALYISCDSLMYAPLISEAVRDIPSERSGVAIGFYNLVINIGFPLGAAYSARLIESDVRFLGGLTIGGTDAGALSSTMLWILAGVAALALLVYAVGSILVATRDSRSSRTSEQLGAI